MEEVVGSNPTRSTKSLNYLAEAARGGGRKFQEASTVAGVSLPNPLYGNVGGGRQSSSFGSTLSSARLELVTNSCVPTTARSSG
jgi:hypothetical protein